MALIDEIDAFLERTGMSQTAFGTQALNDPPFVQQLRDGRDIKMSTGERVRAFMENWSPPPSELSRDGPAEQAA